MTITSWTWLSIFFIGIILFYFYTKLNKFFRCCLFTAATGVGGLGLLWLAGLIFPVTVTITPLTLAASTLLGIPGILAMLIINLI